ncbi:MAG: gamma carbonic anhydrase family protein [Deltaproteobacteria bacterium]|jgi:carbonic anhydrase/acetyltransferase-like protein (isoleucine patch superfamily)|nr:gamma carbonic anhydrase family protein [Deltaproteobacteria bacterium]|tara:strand:+ start:962 stop:1486 length:525 start_codon:yes stop_codon:yes gene_type:complete
MLYSLDNLTPRTHSDDFYVANGATVIGNVLLDQDASVWFGAVVRGDTELITIGKRSNVQDCAVLHTDEGYPLLIDSDVTVGHHAMLHGCTIGAGSLIGIHAIVLNGAQIGKGCLIGANALITEGMQIPDGSVVMGSPGKIKGDLDLEMQKKLIASAHHYVQNYKRFKTGLKKVN